MVKSNRMAFLKSSTVVRITENKLEIFRKDPISIESINNVADNPTYSGYHDWT